MLEFRTSQASAAAAFIFILSFPVRGQVFETVPPLSPREKTIVEDYFHPPGNPNLGLRDYGKGPDGSFGITTSRPMIHYSVSGQTKFASSEDEILHSIYCSLSGIVIARATGSSSMFIHEKRWIVTRTSFNVASIVKAGHELSVGSSFFAIRQGGAIDENGETLAVHVRDSSDFVPGKQYLVFLRTSAGELRFPITLQIRKPSRLPMGNSRSTVASCKACIRVNQHRLQPSTFTSWLTPIAAEAGVCSESSAAISDGRCRNGQEVVLGTASRVSGSNARRMQHRQRSRSEPARLQPACDLAQNRASIFAGSPMPTDATTRTAPYGSWPSPVTADLIAGASIRFGQLALRGTDILWTEGRPQEQGRNVLVERRADGQARDLNPPPTNVRTRAHEYGGGAFVALPDGVVFCNYDDQQLYRIDAAGAVRQLTRDVAQRYADMVPDLARARLIAVREDHAGGDIDAVSTLVAISLVDGSVQVLAQGDDFYSSPTLSPDGRQLAWLSWNHPNMPWDGTTLWQSEISADGSLAGPRQVAGGPRESVFQPCWSPQGELHFVSDRSGWWNLYRLRSGKTQSVMPMSAEFGTPQWVFGMTTYGFDGAGRIVCSYASAGTWRIALLSPDDGGVQRLELPYCAIDGLKVGADFAVFVGATPTRPAAIVRLELASGTCVELRNSSSAEVDPAFVSRAEAIAFPTEGGLTAHAFYYPPTHRELRGPEGERAPLIVISHGGPTAASDAAFKWSHQYWTSRGFAVVDVNYGGSSGYGRAYRERLNGRWGVVDVDDAVHAARYLVARGDVHPERVAIRGGSAGGYTTLCALTFRDFFKAGASHYGIGDLEALATDTHKFESRYLDRLVGPYPAQRALYRERSPIHHTDRLAAPMILFQGAEDKAVPPAQAEQMAAAVDAKGLPVAYLLFEGEQHGFRRAATIKRVLEAELYFYGRVFGFEPADTIEPVEIRNLPR